MDSDTRPGSSVAQTCSSHRKDEIRGRSAGRSFPFLFFLPLFLVQLVPSLCPQNLNLALDRGRTRRTLSPEAVTRGGDVADVAAGRKATPASGYRRGPTSMTRETCCVEASARAGDESGAVERSHERPRDSDAPTTARQTRSPTKDHRPPSSDNVHPTRVLSGLPAGLCRAPTRTPRLHGRRGRRVRDRWRFVLSNAMGATRRAGNARSGRSECPHSSTSRRTPSRFHSESRVLAAAVRTRAT